ncbi:MAG TPA: hypothetical protein GXX75_25070 [Clostridiales bacterium]|nr:hypothetical protein [Clostridiales bacterium]
MASKGSIRLNIGGASIIVILLTLSLTIFAILSIRTSYHELKLSEKTVGNVEEYYQADSKAEEILMQLGELLYQLNWDGSQEQWERLMSGAAKLDGVAGISRQEGLITYEVIMNEASVLKIEVTPEIRASVPHLSVISWKMVTEEQGDYDSNSLEIWDGIIEE